MIEIFKILLIYLAAVNLAAAVVVIYDKHISRRPRGSVRRVAEKTFVRLSILGGGIGTLLAMLLAHHKTRSHNILLLKIVLFAFLWTALLLAILAMKP